MAAPVRNFDVVFLRVRNPTIQAQITNPNKYPPVGPNRTIMLRHGAFADILQPVVQLLAFAAAALAAAVWLNHRQSA